MSRKFQRKIEDFTCENCGTFVKGDGYTNHCPKCLWSKHVDINPGDRLSSCNGLMKPTETFFRNQKWHLIHECQKCGKRGNIKVRDADLKKIISLENQGGKNERS